MAPRRAPVDFGARPSFANSPIRVDHAGHQRRSLMHRSRTFTSARLVLWNVMTSRWRTLPQSSPAS